MYTSGTTGQPKGAIITHGMTFWNCVNLGGPVIFAASVLLTVLPLFHTGGLNRHTNPVLHAGGTVLIMRAFDPGVALQLISDPAPRHQPVFRRAFDLPVHVAASGVRDRRFQSARPRRRRRRADAGAAVESVGRARRRAVAGLWHDRDQPGGADARQGGCRAQGRLVRQAGAAHGVRIVRPDGSDAGINELGELWVRGPNVTPGYWNRPDANASSFTDGWLHTGDATRVDDEGFYYIVDRWKDMYISGGENVVSGRSGKRIASARGRCRSRDHRRAQCAMGRGRHGDRGREAGPPALTPAEIHAHCAANLARFKCPKLIEFVDALPRNATGEDLQADAAGEIQCGEGDGQSRFVGCRMGRAQRNPSIFAKMMGFASLYPSYKGNKNPPVDHRRV